MLCPVALVAFVSLRYGMSSWVGLRAAGALYAVCLIPGYLVQRHLFGIRSRTPFEGLISALLLGAMLSPPLWYLSAWAGLSATFYAVAFALGLIVPLRRIVVSNGQSADLPIPRQTRHRSHGLSPNEYPPERSPESHPLAMSRGRGMWARSPKASDVVEHHELGDMVIDVVARCLSARFGIYLSQWLVRSKRRSPPHERGGYGTTSPIGQQGPVVWKDFTDEQACAPERVLRNPCCLEHLL